MLTLIWLIFTTAIGWAIGHFFFPEHVMFASFLGFLIGVLIRVGAGDEAIDVIGDSID